MYTTLRCIRKAINLVDKTGRWKNIKDNLALGRRIGLLTIEKLRNDIELNLLNSYVIVDKDSFLREIYGLLLVNESRSVDPLASLSVADKEALLAKGFVAPKKELNFIFDFVLAYPLTMLKDQPELISLLSQYSNLVKSLNQANNYQIKGITLALLGKALGDLAYRGSKANSKVFVNIANPRLIPIVERYGLRKMTLEEYAKMT